MNSVEPWIIKQKGGTIEEGRILESKQSGKIIWLERRDRKIDSPSPTLLTVILGIAVRERS